jgi:hypothetical protein
VVSVSRSKRVGHAMARRLGLGREGRPSRVLAMFSADWLPFTNARNASIVLANVKNEELSAAICAHVHRPWVAPGTLER